MKFQLTNNESFEINGTINNTPKTINVLTDFDNKIDIIEATGTLPTVAAIGTICKLTKLPVTIIDSTTAQAGDVLAFPIWVEGSNIDWTLIADELTAHYDIRLSINNGSAVLTSYDNGQDDCTWNGVEEYDGVFKFEDPNGDYLGGCVYASSINDGYTIYTSYSQTIIPGSTSMYISNGNEWQKINNSYVEATGTLPTIVPESGTICKVIANSTNTEWVEITPSNGEVDFPVAIYAEEITSSHDVFFCLNTSSHGGCDLRVSPNGDVTVYFDTGGGSNDGDVTIESDEIEIGNKTCILFEAAPTATYMGMPTILPWTWNTSTLTSFFNDNGKIYQQVTTTTNAEDIFYISNGTNWIQISGGSNSSNGGIRQIYTSVRDLDGVGYALCVEGADDLINEGYVPVLFRRCKTSKRGWLWRHYTPENRTKSPALVTMGSAELVKFTPMQITPPQTVPVFKYVLIDGESDTTNYPQPHNDTHGFMVVSHGKRQYKLYDGEKRHNYKAKWGVALIALSDFPDEHTALDISKLATNIAPFYIYYCWDMNGNPHMTIIT